MIKYLGNFLCKAFGIGPPINPTTKRSGEWPRVRKEHLAIEPACAVCGATESLNVHHVIPVHIDPTKELDKNNFITLCEGAHHLNCHLLFGHLQNWSSYNITVREDVKVWSQKISQRP